jgi:hypothetical protein
MKNMQYFRLTQLLLTLLIGACLSLTANADSAIADELRTMFQVLETEQQLIQVTTMLEQQHAATVAQETDPEKKAIKQRQHDAVAELLRQEMSWEKFEPMAIETYAKHLEKQDVEAMNDFLGSTEGKVYVKKYLPALMRGTMVSVTLAGERADLIHAALTNKETPLPEPMSAPETTDDSHQLIARKILTTFRRKAFDKQMAELSGHMEEQMRMLGPMQGIIDKDEMDKFIAEFSVAFEQDANFDAYMLPIANELTANLSEKELNGLFHVFTKPEWKSLETKTEAADGELKSVIGKYVQEQVMPKIFKVVMSNT